MNYTLIGILVSLVPLLLIGIAIGWGFLIGVRNVRIRIIGVAVSFIAALITALCVKHTQFADIFGLIEPLMAGSEELSEIMTLMQGAVTLMQDVTLAATAFVAPLVFAVSFIIYALITWIIGWIVSLIITLVKSGSEKKSGKPVEIISYATAQVLVTVFVLMIPVIAYLNFLPAVIDTGVQFDMIEENSGIEEVIDAADNAPITKVSRFLGGNAFARMLTSFEIGGVKTDIGTEIIAVSDFAGNVSLLTESELKDYGEEESEAFRNLTAGFDRSVLLPAVVGEVVYIVADEWLDESGDGEVLGLKKPEFEDATAAMFRDAFDHILEALYADSHNYDALRADFNTIANVFGILAADGVFEDMGSNDTNALITKLSSGSTVKDLATEFGKNPSFKVLIGDITNIGMKAIGTTLKIPENADVVYQQFNEEIALGMNTVKNGEYTDEEKKAELISAIRSAFLNSGNKLDLDDGALSLYAEALLQDFSDYESVTASDVSEFFSVFALISESGVPGEAMANKNNSSLLLGATTEDTQEYSSPVYAGKTAEELSKGTGAGFLANVLKGIVEASLESENEEAFGLKVKEVLKTSYEEYATAAGKDASLAESFSESVSISLTSVTEESIEKTASMKSSESFDEATVIVTLEDLVVDSEEAAAGLVTDEDIIKEAEAIQDIFVGASEIVVKLSGENAEGVELLKEISEDLGVVLDNLGTTSSVGQDKTSSLVIAIFQSETVRNTADLDIDAATELANEATKENSDGTQSRYTETMGSLATGASVADKLKDDNAELTEDDVRELLNDMTPKTADMLKVYMTEKRVQGFGIPESRAPLAAELINNLLSEMGNKDKYQDTYDAETKGILKIFNLITAARKNKDGTQALFNRDGNTGRMNTTADELVESMLRSEMVCASLLNTQNAHGGVLEDPFGLNINKESADYLELKSALENYYKNNGTDAVRTRVEVVASFMGVTEIEFN